MRRRVAASGPTEQMDKGAGKNHQNRLCFLVTLSAFFWILLLYFHFIVLGTNNVSESNQLETSIKNSESSFVHLTNDDHLAEPRKEATQPSTFRESTDSQFKPVNPEPTNPEPVVHESPQSQSKPINPEPIVHQSPASQPNPVIPEPISQESAGHEVKSFPFMKALETIENKSDPCGGRYIYVHDLPSRFNEDMLKDCKSLSLWTNMCKYTANAGLGPPLANTEGVFSNTGWYTTNQFAVDVIFNNRMKQYKCLTNDSSIAAAIFVPFYAGFDIARYLWGYNISMRDAASLDLVNWLTKRPEWGIMGGKDHFLVAGRITWDFRRGSDEESDWGSKLLFLPATKNLSMLVVESSPWGANDFAIPYPTYFHPSKDAEVFDWQNRMRKLERKWLFSFAGAPRPGDPLSIRGQLMEQCRNSEVGKLLECDFGESKCHSPSSIMQMFQTSIFCLQPQGDSYTRRSAFDSILAEDDIRKRNVSIEERLKQISPEQIMEMRETVINLIPRVIYADPRSKLATFKDSFDVAVQSIIDRVTRLRRLTIEGLPEYDNFVEQNGWKYALLDEGQRSVGPHEWDPFFSKPKNGDDRGRKKFMEE
ncbi:Xyloglucan galactosyltransferase MUR3 [Citrus sinensis]|uniref:Xyloglucan galactosyltransferase MUR3 n=1 Tax=Citrus sinensis TaxID=2711 RepID=A0ACB8MGX2_CITSI|nr:Xyloglucan galactosyltransferase MUR3 [Citrus sinensis]